MEKKKGTAPVAADVSEEGYSFAAMSSGELVNLWKGMIDENKEVAEELFFEVLLRDAAAEYYPRARSFQPRQPSNNTESPPPPPQDASSDPQTIVLALCAPNSRTPWSTTSTMKPRHGKMQAPRGAGEERDHEHHAHPHANAQARSIQLPPRQPSSTAKKLADRAALQTPAPRPQAASFKTVTVLCAPPHLARGVKKRPPPSPNACDPRGKKHRTL